MDAVESFVSNYSEADRSRIAFAWNGEHAQEFVDANQEFRWQVVRACLQSPQDAPPGLLEALFLEDAEWSAQAWGAPHHFGPLGSVLLEYGRDGTLEAFARGCVRSFDTWGACHGIVISSGAAESYLASARLALQGTEDSEARRQLEGAITLLEKVRNGTARQGWATVAPGTPVTNVRVVWPRWYQRFRRYLDSLFRGGAA